MPPPTADFVTLLSVSGRRVVLPCPVTLSAVLNAAVAAPFFFAPQSVKVPVRNRLVHVAAHIKAHAATKDGGVIDAADFSTAAHATTVQRQGHAVGAAAAPSRSLLVFGVPSREKAANVDPKTAEVTSKSAPSPTAVSVANNTGSAATSPTPKISRAAGAPSPSFSAGGASATTVNGTTPAAHAHAASVSDGPLPYPHSPDGLLELAKAVEEPQGDGDDDDDLISLLQGAPQRIYNHPTMRYMSNKVKGDLVTLRGVVAQIARVAPVFYAWMEANPQKFLSALNRVGERSLQQVKEQLRLLALQAVAGQMSGDGPSRRVMTLEVNTRDGTPDLFQVEVQVGDFSDNDSGDDDDEEMEEGEEEEMEMEEGEMGSGSSEYASAYYTGVEQSDAEGEGDGYEDEEATEETAGSNEVSESSSGHLCRVDVDVEAEGGAEDDVEPHRGAILLPPSPATRSVGLAAAGPSAAMAPSPPTGSAPARAWRPSPTTAATTTTTNAAGPSSSTLDPAAAPYTPAASASAAAPAAVAASVDTQEDARLVQLRSECRAVEALRHVYTCQADTASAQHTHAAIMALRPKFFAVVGEVCTALSSATTAEEATQQAAQLRRVVRCATDFFGVAEEFYAQLEGEGVRSSVFGPAPQESLAAWAAVAALSRLLLCDIDAAAHEATSAAASATPSASTTVPAGPRRVGALRALHSDNVLWSNPALHWALTRSPEDLLAAVLLLCRQQRAVLLWYSSHYLVKPVGKTIQTMAYVFGGTEEAQQAVALQRLKFTSKAHKSDEAADCVAELSTTTTAANTAIEAARRQWVGLMRTRYQQLVRPLEGDLPTPHMTSFPLYVCDTRHVLPAKEGLAERGRRAMDSAARWWAGYCDDRNTLCADKWCVVATQRPWNAAMAAANAHDRPAVERVALRLVRAGDAPSGEAAARLFQGLLPTERVAVAADTVPSSSSAAAAAVAPRHAAVLCETVSDGEGATQEVAVAHGMAPRWIGDVHVVDIAAANTSAGPHHASAATMHVASVADVPTHLATIVRNIVVPVSTASSGFLMEFFNMFARHPSIPAGAAARHAALATAKANDAPWLVCEYVLFDYGGAIRSFAASGATSPSALVAAAAASAAEPSSAGDESLVPMPSVPLSRRLSEPRPVSAVSRSRASSQSDSEPRLAARNTTTTAIVTAEEDAVRRHYARTHAIDELYEMMLGSLLEHQPTGEQNVLDHLVNFLEASGDTLQEKVQRRQAEAATAAATTTPVETVSATAAASAKPHHAPQPPSAKRGSKGRPSLSRKK